MPYGKKRQKNIILQLTILQCLQRRVVFQITLQMHDICIIIGKSLFKSNTIVLFLHVFCRDYAYVI